MFECVGSPASCECGAYGIGTLKLDHQESLETSKIADISRYWRDAMSQYSQLHLTYHSDRLSALAGIARQYGTTHKNTLGRYVAGMWENTLVNDLLWLVANGYQSNRPEVCYAPTWSWASVTGGTSTLALTSTTQTLEIVGLELKLAGQDEFGALSTATLTVRGQLTPGSWRWVSRPGGWEGIHFYAYASGEETTHHLKLDYNFSVTGNSRHVAPGSTIFCLKTGFVAAGSHVFMVLRMVNEEQRVFERIGLLQGVSREEAEAWMSGEPEQEIIHLV
jgi:hypothetical protein